ncbi:MAG: SPASM domain-containing protein [Candidatus Zixiibacteriota bacterium]
MKQSRYCFLFGIEDGKGLLFSSANGALAELDPESYPQVKRFLAGTPPDSTSNGHELWEALIANEFLVDESCDELGELEQSSIRERTANDTLSLTIAPTLACNFGCDYCFERHSPIRMNEETEKALLSFAEQHLGKVNHLQTTWFGGEPTLCLSQIERLQAKFSELCEKIGATFEPGMIVTNGYLLDKTMAIRLKAAGITLAQITLDGPKEIHDTRRPLKNGQGSFDRIIENVSRIYDILQIALRINIDRDNIDAAADMVEELKDRGLLQHINVHFAQVTASGATCASIRDRCFSDREFSERQAQLYRKLFDRDIYMVEYPQVFSGGHCGAVSENSFVISPTGDIFKCWEELSLDAEKSVGNISSKVSTHRQQENGENYLAWDPFCKSECRKCNILPICMGGCPVQGMRMGDPDKGACSPFKYSLKEMLVLRYLCNARKEVST